MTDEMRQHLKIFSATGPCKPILQGVVDWPLKTGPGGEGTSLGRLPRCKTQFLTLGSPPRMRSIVPIRCFRIGQMTTPS